MANRFQIRICTQEDHKKILEFANENFVPFEPLCQGLGALAEEIEEFHAKAIEDWIHDGFSLAAYAGEDGLAGILLTKILTRENYKTFEYKGNFNEKTRTLLSVLGQIENAVNIFEDNSVEKVLELAFLSVDKLYSGQGLSYLLVKEVEKLAAQIGCTYVYTQASASGSQHIFIKSGFEVIKEVPYKSIEVEGKNPFNFENMFGVKCAKIVKKYIKPENDSI